MDCKLESICPFKSDCGHKDMAEFCSYHRNNYDGDQSSTTAKPEYFDAMNTQIDDGKFYLDLGNKKAANQEPPFYDD